MATEILSDVEITTYPCLSYPALTDFLRDLDANQPGYNWQQWFLGPLRWSGVRTLNDMWIALPESLHVLYGLPPILVMDFYTHVVAAIEMLHAAHCLEHGIICDTCRTRIMW